MTTIIIGIQHGRAVHDRLYSDRALRANLRLLGCDPCEVHRTRREIRIACRGPVTVAAKRYVRCLVGEVGTIGYVGVCERRPAAAERGVPTAAYPGRSW